MRPIIGRLRSNRDRFCNAANRDNHVHVVVAYRCSLIPAAFHRHRSVPPPVHTSASERNQRSEVRAYPRFCHQPVTKAGFGTLPTSSSSRRDCRAEASRKATNSPRNQPDRSLMGNLEPCLFRVL